MNILYISNISADIAVGLTWSVPASIKAQRLYDNVLWVNLTNSKMEHWEDTGVYHCLSEFGKKLCLAILPEPFNCPDVVVFEGFYHLNEVVFSWELRHRKIPYIIIPRGSLTEKALHNHAWFKKWVAHKLFFNKFINKAWKIQYLTQQEAADSAKRFKTANFVIPNGVNIPQRIKESFFVNGLQATYIGRLDIYHKGIDLLLDAISRIHNELWNVKFTLNIYGPQKQDYYKIADEVKIRKIDDIVFLHNRVGGEEKAKVLLQSDVFIMTSRFEGHPMGLIEALAYGLPCVVTPGTNMAKEVRNADAGWVSDGSTESIAETLLTVIDEKKVYVKKSKHARELAKLYDWDELAKAFHKELMSLNSYKSNYM